jgi:hypothetical protein
LELAVCSVLPGVTPHVGWGGVGGWSPAPVFGWPRVAGMCVAGLKRPTMCVSTKMLLQDHFMGARGTDGMPTA